MGPSHVSDGFLPGQLDLGRRAETGPTSKVSNAQLIPEVIPEVQNMLRKPTEHEPSGYMNEYHNTITYIRFIEHL